MPDAAKMFFGDPKQDPPMSPVVEKLLPYLDTTTTLRLLQSGTSCLLKHLQRDAMVWKKLVQRTLPDNYKIGAAPLWTYSTRVREAFEEKRVQLGSLINILKMLEEPNSYMVYLLQLICEKSPEDMIIGGGRAIIQISNPSQGSSSSVSPLGFLLCEEVEAAFGSAFQQVSSIGVRRLEEPWLTALASRVSRQKKLVTNMKSEEVMLTNKGSAEALLTLVQCGEK